MPKRTNPRQQIIELLVSMNASPGCTVTPSKSLRDVHSGLGREVDAVVERRIDRETSTWSYEVVASRRPADVEWVEAMIAKHENLPTEKLFLVSWSGFTRGARRQAATNPGAGLVVDWTWLTYVPDHEQMKMTHVNERREFFFATPAEVQEVLALKVGNLLEFIDEPEATHRHRAGRTSTPAHQHRPLAPTGEQRTPCSTYSLGMVDRLSTRRLR
jgi:hypothetical protein